MGKSYCVKVRILRLEKLRKQVYHALEKSDFQPCPSIGINGASDMRKNRGKTGFHPGENGGINKEESIRP